MGNAGWGVLIVERSADGAVFDLSHQGVEVAPVLSGYHWANEQRLWELASTYPTFPSVQPTNNKPATLRWVFCPMAWRCSPTRN